MSVVTLQAFVHAMRYEAEGILSIELRPASEDVVFPEFDAGAHIDLHLSNGLVRNYSLLNAKTDRQRYVIGVLNDRASRGGSRYIHEQLRVGTSLLISPPRNNFRLNEEAPRSVLLAGGIGVTPMLSMLRTLASQNKPVDFIYCARSRQEAAFLEEIENYANVAGVRLIRHFNDEQGGLPNLMQLLSGYTADAHLYGCGPASMLDAFEHACASLGYGNVHIERFAAPSRTMEQGMPGIGASAANGTEALQAGGYTVELRRTGKVLQVSPGMSLLDALLAAGIEHHYSCREGLCGACEIKVLDGEVDHRDSILTRSERAANKSMMVCVSGCKQGPLVLDI